jgi:hypothetical protein
LLASKRPINSARCKENQINGITALAVGIYVNGVMNVSGSSKWVLYADNILLYRSISCQADYASLQHDSDSIDSWVSDNHLQFNIAECKFMLISRKRPRAYYHSLTASWMKQKVLGTTFYNRLEHIRSICANQIRSLWECYTDTSINNPNREIFINYICPCMAGPHLEHASPVRSPYKSMDITAYGNVQKFGGRNCTKQWNSGCDHLLKLLDLPALACRRL